jgi:hypothetical protein
VPLSSYCDTSVDIWSLQFVVVVVAAAAAAAAVAAAAAAAAVVVVVVDDVVVIVVGFVAVAVPALFFLLFLSFLDYKQI